MRANYIEVVVASLMLAACGSQVETPSSVQGTWGAECSSPFIRIGVNQIHVYPDNADYDLKSVKLEGANLTLGYTSSAGPVVETYIIEGDTLRLDHGTYTGSDATWHKQPMKKC